MDLDRQSIEKRDFPIGRRGYDPAAVDAHLRALASEVEELQQRTLAGRGADSLAASAGTQVQAIVAAAEVAAAEIESDANANAESTRARAAQDAEKTRADAIAKAQAHVANVARATATLLARVESLDGETGALVDSLRGGATRLASDLTAVEADMGELYGAASSGGASDLVAAVAQDASAPPEAPSLPPDTPPSPVAAEAPAPPLPTPLIPVPPPVSPSPPARPATENGDLDGARLVALNMALNGDSREATDKYLAENYEVADRVKLLDEVYAAIEG